MKPEDLNKELGNLDLFLLDQILKGRFHPGMEILDTGCGEGRNLLYFMKEGYQVFGLDQSESALKMCRIHARTLGREKLADHFITGDAAELPFDDNRFDAVMSFSVLHFSEGEAHFRQQVEEIHRVLKPGGVSLMKAQSLITGVEEVIDKGNGLFQTGSGDIRYLMKVSDIAWISEMMEPVEQEKIEIIERNLEFASLVLRKN